MTVLNYNFYPSIASDLCSKYEILLPGFRGDIIIPDVVIKNDDKNTENRHKLKSSLCTYKNKYYLLYKFSKTTHRTIVKLKFFVCCVIVEFV